MPPQQQQKHEVIVEQQSLHFNMNDWDKTSFLKRQKKKTQQWTKQYVWSDGINDGPFKMQIFFLSADSDFDTTILAFRWNKIGNK